MVPCLRAPMSTVLTELMAMFKENSQAILTSLCDVVTAHGRLCVYWNVFCLSDKELKRSTLLELVDHVNSPSGQQVNDSRIEIFVSWSIAMQTCPQGSRLVGAHEGRCYYSDLKVFFAVCFAQQCRVQVPPLNMV